MGALAFVLCAPAASCVGVLGIGPMRQDACGGFAFADPMCAECAWSACCAEAAACGLDGPCSDAEHCRSACGPDDPVCRQACAVAFGPTEESPALATVDACRRGSCLDSCYGVGGWARFFDGLTNDGGQACEDCIGTCEVLLRGCMARADCEESFACRAAATDNAAYAACAAAHPEFATNLGEQALASCMKKCGLACGFAADFACVDHYSWFGDTEPMLAYALALTTAESSGLDPLVGATVRACPSATCGSCLDPLAPDNVTTDATGTAHMVVPNAFFGCFAISGAGREPTLLYLGKPLVHATEPGQVPIAPQGIVTLLAATLGVPLLGERGQLAVEQRDCRFSTGVVAQFASDEADPPTSSPFAYGSGEDYAFGAQGSFGLMLNHPAGTALVRSVVAGQEVASAAIYVAPGVVTAVQLRPRWIH